MRCALVFYLVTTLFIVVYSSLPEQCKFNNDMNGVKRALCGRHHVEYTFDFIPPVSQYISSINLEGQPLKQLPYNAFRNVTSQSSVSGIWLRYCQINHVDAGALLNLHNLTVIGLLHNDITQLESNLFSHTKQLRVIYMEYNKIQIVPSGLFQNLTLLEAVHLNHNRIRQVARFSFRNTPSLGLIVLNNNQIEFMDMLFKDKFENLQYLLLWDNPWKCDCDLGPLYEFLIKSNLLNQHRLVCVEPATLQGRQWSDINRDKFVCRSEDAIISTQDSIVTRTEPMTTTEQDDNKPVAVDNGTRYQPVDTDIPQSFSNHDWILYTISVLVCVTAVITGVVFLKRRSFRRANTCNMNYDLSMRIIESRAASEIDDSASNTGDVYEEQTSIHHCEVREAPTIESSKKDIQLPAGLNVLIM